MEEILVMGHKSPDTDSVLSAIVMAEYEKKLGNNASAVALGKINKETKYVFDYLNIEEIPIIERVNDEQKIILVDHNEAAQSVENRENAKILKVIDHHKMDFKIDEPIYYRTEPLGCTSTVLYKMYKESNFEISKNIAILMLSAIISDTLLLKSPTCTEEDKKAVEELNQIAGLNIQEYGLALLKAGTDLSDYTSEELINLDAKEVEIGGVKAVIAQVNVVSIEEMMQKKEQIELAINNEIQNKGLGLFFFAITDIINSNSQVIVLGNRRDIVEKSYNVKLENNTTFLPGVVSRKKQIIPVLSKNV